MESILVNQNELYLDYSSWLYPASEDGIRRSCEFLRPMFIFRVFLEDGQIYGKQCCAMFISTLN